jgi:hypothetical protein
MKFILKFLEDRKLIYVLVNLLYIICGRGQMHKGFWWENLREREHLEDPGVDGRIILK